MVVAGTGTPPEQRSTDADWRGTSLRNLSSVGNGSVASSTHRGKGVERRFSFRVACSHRIFGALDTIFQIPPTTMDDVPNPLAESGVTMHSDSEQYSPGEDITTSPTSSGSPVILYKPPTIWSLVRGAAINLLLPFINGMMLGFGELFAHEAAFRLGWGGTKVR